MEAAVEAANGAAALETAVAERASAARTVSLPGGIKTQLAICSSVGLARRETGAGTPIMVEVRLEAVGGSRKRVSAARKVRLADATVRPALTLPPFTTRLQRNKAMCFGISSSVWAPGSVPPRAP